MGGVTQQKQVMLTPTLRNQGMESITRRAPDRRLRGRQPALEQAPQDFLAYDSGRIFSWQEHDLPTP